jgi:hypothetical protein
VPRHVPEYEALLFRRGDKRLRNVCDHELRIARQAMLSLMMADGWSTTPVALRRASAARAPAPPPSVPVAHLNGRA